MDKVLIIQDSVLINSMLKNRLESEGFFVEVAVTGEDGLKKAESENYKLILLDVKLPGMDGAEVCKTLRMGEAFESTPILFLSAKNESELAQLAQDAGADGYITLPFKGEALIRKVKETIVAKSARNVTIYEEDFYGKKEIKEKTVQIVLFRLSQEWYGADILGAKEILKVERIAYLPSSLEYVRGIINLRGSILAVTDLKNIFGLPFEDETDKTRIVVISSGNVETGLLVDEVKEIIEVPFAKIEPALATISPEKAQYLAGTYKVGDKLVGILKVEKILNQKVC